MILELASLVVCIAQIVLAFRVARMKKISPIIGNTLALLATLDYWVAIRLRDGLV